MRFDARCGGAKLLLQPANFTFAAFIVESDTTITVPDSRTFSPPSGESESTQKEQAEGKPLTTCVNIAKELSKQKKGIQYIQPAQFFLVTSSCVIKKMNHSSIDREREKGSRHCIKEVRKRNKRKTRRMETYKNIMTRNWEQYKRMYSS